MRASAVAQTRAKARRVLGRLEISWKTEYSGVPRRAQHAHGHTAVPGCEHVVHALRVRARAARDVRHCGAALASPNGWASSRGWPIAPPAVPIALRFNGVISRYRRVCVSVRQSGSQRCVQAVAAICRFVKNWLTIILIHTRRSSRCATKLRLVQLTQLAIVCGDQGAQRLNHQAQQAQSIQTGMAAAATLLSSCQSRKSNRRMTVAPTYQGHHNGNMASRVRIAVNVCHGFPPQTPMAMQQYGQVTPHYLAKSDLAFMPIWVNLYVMSFE